MPSVNDLSSNQAVELSHDGVAPITPEVKLTANMRGYQSTQPNGAYVFGTNGYVINELDLSSYLQNDYVVIKSQIPFLPTNGQPVDNEGDVRIRVANGIKYIGAIQDEGILDPDTIQDAEIEINANCGSMDALPMYRGRVVKAPIEAEGYTTFSTKSTMWDIIDVEVRHERITGGQIAPLFHLRSNGLLSKAYTQPSGWNIQFNHGITIFNENGELKSSVTNSKSADIRLLRVDFFDNANGDSSPLGKYTIKFFSETKYTLTNPSNEQFTGDINSDLASGFVRIDSDYWTVLGDPTDAEIVFYCSYTVKGNPVAIVKNLLYKAFSGDWGNNPQTPTTQDVDWDTFTQYEVYFNSTTVFVSETNQDNGVFDPFSGEKPLRIKDFCQRILEHVGGQLTFNASGQISMTSDWYLLPTETVPVYQTGMLSSGTTRGPAHSINGSGPKYNRMVVKYGLNPLTGNFAGETTFILGNVSRYSTLQVSFPYFKVNFNDHNVSALDCTLWEIVKTASSVLKMSLKPNWGLPVAPGDKFEVLLTTQPVLPHSVTGVGKYWQIHKVSKRIGGVVDIEAHMIPRPGFPLQLCEWELCEDSLGAQYPVVPEPNTGFTYTFPYQLS